MSESYYIGSAERLAKVNSEAIFRADCIARQTKAFEIEKLNFYYGNFHALKDITINMEKNKATALIGPSGCGKSTFLRCLNRFGELTEGARTEGLIKLFGKNIDDEEITSLRKRVGMVFQKPNPFIMSVYENIAFAPRTYGLKKRELDELCENCLKKAGLWDEVKDRLHKSALGLSGGQQQRLCIARSLAVNPEVLLLDEPTSALDPISTQKIEELITQLKQSLTVIIVTHNMGQAERVSDEIAFFLSGEIIESGNTREIFDGAKDERTRAYIARRFG